MFPVRRENRRWAKIITPPFTTNFRTMMSKNFQLVNRVLKVCALKPNGVSFKQLFFASTLIADDAFPTVDIKTELTKEDPRYVGKFNADVAIPYEGKDSETIKMKFYFGPSHIHHTETV